MGSIHGTFITDLSKYNYKDREKVIERYEKMYGASNIFERYDCLYRR